MDENKTILDIVEILSSISETIHLYGVASPDTSPRDVRIALSDLISDTNFYLKNETDSTKRLKFLLSSLTTATTRTLTIPDISGLLAVAGMLNAFSFGGQAHGGYNTIAYSASITFNCNNGNLQGTTFTGDSALSFSNELAGTFIYKGRISGSGVNSITLDSSWGTAIDNNAEITYNDGDTFTITVVVDDLGNKEYTINTKTA